jgi:ribosome biogenesis GTPase
LIDTPGVREFGIELEAESGFPEFAEAAALCRFRDCRHLQEHDCGVKSAVREGTISRERYITYCRLLGTSADEQDDFQCVHCGQLVSGVAPGSRFRNHCPQCLWSRHVDTIPGDRGAACDGAMEPIAVWLRKGGEWCLIHRCDQCGVIHSNRVAGDDLDWALMSLAARPIANPPFSLTSMGA